MISYNSIGMYNSIIRLQMDRQFDVMVEQNDRNFGIGLNKTVYMVYSLMILDDNGRFQ